MSPSTRTEPIRLHYEDRTRQVVVTAKEDKGRFVTTVEAAIEACAARQNAAEFCSQFQELLRHLDEWIKTHRKKISKAFVTVRDTGLLFLILQHSPEYDRALEDELTELDVEIAQDVCYSLLNLNVLALPAGGGGAETGFLAPVYTLTYPDAE